MALSIFLRYVGWHVIYLLYDSILFIFLLVQSIKFIVSSDRFVVLNNVPHMTNIFFSVFNQLS